MLKHLYTTPQKPSRVVVLGAAGFVGGASVARLKAAGISVLGFTRKELDLLSPEAEGKLLSALQPNDVLLVVSALAPCKSHEMLLDNLRMFAPVVQALQKVELSQVVYISSDAVFSDSDKPMTEDSEKLPTAWHGIMHLSRELALMGSARCPLAILRPTLIYGASDPHNGYGPNRFMRTAAESGEIKLFGAGEERRDHVNVDDVAEIVTRTILHKSEGSLNVVTGVVTSFMDIAKQVAKMVTPEAKIIETPRSGPMPHNGYRAFDIAACRQAFPDFTYTSLSDGLVKTFQGMKLR